LPYYESNECLDSCHLIPESEEYWFIKNGMGLFCEGDREDVNDIRNAIALRADMHQLFDNGTFVYVPKNGEMRLHFLFPSWTNSHFKYQNSLFSMTHIPYQYLYARFAWAVFKRTIPLHLELNFEADGKPRLSRREARGRDSNTRLGKRKPEPNTTSLRRSKLPKSRSSAAGKQADSDDSVA